MNVQILESGKEDLRDGRLFYERHRGWDCECLRGCGQSPRSRLDSSPPSGDAWVRTVANEIRSAFANPVNSCFLTAVLIAAVSWTAAGRDLAEHVRFLAELTFDRTKGRQL